MPKIYICDGKEIVYYKSVVGETEYNSRDGNTTTYKERLLGYQRNTGRGIIDTPDESGVYQSLYGPMELNMDNLIKRNQHNQRVMQISGNALRRLVDMEGVSMKTRRLKKQSYSVVINEGGEGMIALNKKVKIGVRLNKKLYDLERETKKK